MEGTKMGVVKRVAGWASGIACAPQMGRLRTYGHECESLGLLAQGDQRQFQDGLPRQWLGV